MPRDDAWTVVPGVPGAMLPQAGRSLFDHAFAAGGSHELPFPFAALVRKLEAQVGVDALGRPGVKRVLIPLGRSLQRTAGAADFFRFPRVVVAVDGEPRFAHGPLLKDRLYIGYQENAAVLEVISYNEALGRFEFQVVKDYRAGGTPRVHYANRTVCAACHQNGAPIFSRQQWDETNANPRLRARLAAHGAAHYGVSVARGVDEPYAIDNASDRANRLAAYQLLWREGCGGDDARSAACRAAALVLALQYRLSGASQLDRDGRRYRVDYAPPLEARWRTLWPQGLSLPDPDLPNRDPGVRIAASASVIDAHVPAQFDPLLPRAPLETWRADNRDDLDRLIRGLPEFLAQSDIERLDRALRHASGDAPLRAVDATCSAARKRASARAVRLSFRCGGPGEPAALRGRIYLRDAKVTGGGVESLSLGVLGVLDAAEVAGGTTRGRYAQFALSRGNLAARTHRGNAVERIELRWSDDGTGTASVAVREDFARLDAAVTTLQRTHGGELLGPQPFRRAVAMPALLGALGAEPGRWCCADAAGLPAPILAGPVDERRAIGADATLARFYRYCAVCHDTADRAPPNFLAGEPTQVRARLAHCAPRIFVRLGMWSLEGPLRAKTPMPPPLALRAHGMSAEQWRDDAALSAMLGDVAGWLKAESGAAPQLRDYLERGYENLRPCLN
ncbi:MAG TPA: hypothetical protein VFU53_12605 [Burkholderiales bacterium]|nr:hypothetical protein [Burkholderiales bacterium]